MAQELRANTAVDVLIGPCVDTTDGDTAEEGLTIEDEHVLLSKLGQALAAKNDANDAVHDAEGYYNCPLNTTDTNTEGTLVVTTHMTGALHVRHEYMVLSEAAWDSKYVAKDDGFMDVNIKTVGRTDAQETEANNLESACSNYSVTRGLTGTAVPAAVADAAGGMVISDDGGVDMDELYDGIVTDAQGTNVAEDVAAAIGTDSKCLISTDAQDLSGTLDVNTKTATATALDAILKNSTFALAIADAIWDEVLTGATHNVSTSAGRRLRNAEAGVILTEGTAQAGGAATIQLEAGSSATNDLYNHSLLVITGGTGVGQAHSIQDYDGGTVTVTVAPNWRTQPDATSTYAIHAFGEVDVYKVETGGITSGSFAANAIDAAATAADFLAEINAECDTALSDYDAPTKAEMDTAHALLATPAQVNAQCDTALSDYGANTTVPDAAGTAATPAEVATALTNYAGPTKAEMDTAHALLATPAQVNTQVVDALATDTYAEPGQGAPGATVSLATKIGYLYKLLRNKITNDGSDIKVYNDAGAVVDQKSTVSEAAGTVTRGEFGTGP